MDTDQQTPTSPDQTLHPAPLSARVVLFDLDGTLVDSTPIVVRCWTRWAKEYAITREDFDRVHTHGRTAAGIVADLLPPDQVDGAIRRIVELETAEVDGLKVLPGAREAFAAIPSERRAIVTSGTHQIASGRLQAAGLDPGMLVTADDVRRGKPDPEPYLLAAERLGVDPADCVVAEDAPVGLAAARAAGMRTIAVTTTHEPDELDADLVVHRLDDLRIEWSGDELVLSAR